MNVSVFEYEPAFSGIVGGDRLLELQRHRVIADRAAVVNSVSGLPVMFANAVFGFAAFVARTLSAAAAACPC